MLDDIETAQRSGECRQLALELGLQADGVMDRLHPLLGCLFQARYSSPEDGDDSGLDADFWLNCLLSLPSSSYNG